MVTAAALRALALLGAIAASLVLFVQGILGGGLAEFVKTNAFSFPVRLSLLLAMAIAFALAVLGGALYGWRGDALRLRHLAHSLAPLAAMGLLPPLCVPAAWPNSLDAALAIGCFVLLAERLIRLSLQAVTDGPSWALRCPRLRLLLAPAARCWASFAFVSAGAIGYAIYMSIYTLRMHGRFQTYGYDLGQYDNVFWSTLHGHPLWDAPLGLTYDWAELRNHADLSTFFFLPFYALKPGAPALLVIQSCVMGLGAIPLYRFAARHLPRSYACVIALAYLGYPPLHGLQFYDFHFQPVASTFVLFVVDFVDERRYWLCAIAFVVALGCREDVPIGLVVLGIFLVMSGYRARAGIVMAVVAGSYFLVIRFMIMPRFGPTHLNASPLGAGTFIFIYKDLIPEGTQSLGGVLATLVSNPAYVFSTLVTADKFRYALQILLPLALLPVRRAYLAVSVVHGALLTLLTTRYAPTIDIGFQYSANFIPYIFPASVLALERFGDTVPGRARRRAGLASIVIGTVLCGVFWGAIPPRKSIKGGFETLPMTPPTPADRAKHEDLVALHNLVPSGAWLAVSEVEMPHISRLNMLSLRDTTDADYLLYGVGSGYFGSSNAERVLAAGEFEKVAERPGLVLLKRKVPSPGR